MSKLTDIKYRIDQLDGGAFQNLCDAYLCCKGYGTVYSLGMNTGTDKTAKGNPDTYFLTTNDKYVFVMYTTQKTMFVPKALDDIKKCFDKSKTGLSPNDVSEIVYCYTYGRLMPGEHQTLVKYCEGYNAKLTLIGLDELGKDLYLYYPRLVRDHLNISVDTGQIMSLKDFVETNDANQMSAPLNTDFLYREEELRSATEKLEESNVLVITGASGTGKTRLALKICEALSKEKGLEVLCIKSNGLELYDDLMTEIELGTAYLVFVDDANELSGFHYVLDLLSKATLGQKSICKIIVTVRDYAKQQVVEQILEVEKPEILKIELFKDEEVQKLTESVYGITNHAYLDRIVAIAEGNARLAMLAGRLAKEAGTLESIRDASELYNNYYGKQIDIITNSETGIVSAGIIAFFQVLHLGHLEHLKPIFTVAHITEEQFISDLKQLHDVELVDLCQDMAAKISDQSFSNYLIKCVFIDKKAIPLDQMIERGFFVNKKRTIAACNILLNVFSDKNVQEYVEHQINNVWDCLTDDVERFPAFFKAFHMVRPTMTLILLKERIDAESVQQFDVNSIKFNKRENEKSIDDDIINILCSFQLHRQLPEAVSLLLLYYQKRPDLFEQVYSAFVSGFGVNKESHRFGYYTQKIVTERLCSTLKEKPTENNMLLFVRVAERFLRLFFSNIEGNRNNTFTHYTVPLIAEESVFEYRNNLINQLYEIYKSGGCQREIESLLKDYGERGEKIEKTIIRNDLNAIIPFFSLFSNDNLYHCVIAEKIHEVAQFAEFDSIDVLLPFLEAQKYQIYSALKPHMEDWDSHDYQLKEVRHKARVQTLIQHYDLIDYQNLIKVCNECLHSLDSESRQMASGLKHAFELINNDTELYVEVIKLYLDANTPYDLRADFILHGLFELLSPKEVYALIMCRDFSQKNTWLWYFFTELPNEHISDEWLKCFLIYLQNPPKSIDSSPYLPLDRINKYECVSKDIFIRVCRILDNQYESSPFMFHCYFSCIVNPGKDKAESVIHVFEKDISLLEDIYLKCLRYSETEDYEGDLLDQIIKMDPSFTDRYIDFSIAEDPHYLRIHDNWGHRLLFIWKKSHYLLLMNKISDYIIAHTLEKPWIYSSLISQLLIHHEGIGNIERNQEKWIADTIEQHYHDEHLMYELFKAISDDGETRRRNALKRFLEMNNDYELFKQLPLEASVWGGFGSMIPHMQQRIDYLSSLLPMLAGLDFLQHKQKVMNDIELWRSRIKREEIEELLTSLG